MPVELFGIIYSYNPVDRPKLGLEDDSSQASAVPADAGVAG